jgi:hypothetical protein
MGGYQAGEQRLILRCWVGPNRKAGAVALVDVAGAVSRIGGPAGQRVCGFPVGPFLLVGKFK